MESKKNKLIETEIRFVVARGRGWGERNWVKVVKRYKLPVISSGDLMYSMVTIAKSTVLYI